MVEVLFFCLWSNLVEVEVVVLVGMSIVVVGSE